MTTEGGAVLAHGVRRTNGVTEQPKGGVATVGAMGLVPCPPSGGVAARGKAEMGKVESGNGGGDHALAGAATGGGALGTTCPTVKVSKQVLRLAQHVASGREIRIEGTAGLKHWQGQKIPQGCAFLATDADSGSGLAFLSVEEKEQWDGLQSAHAEVPLPGSMVKTGQVHGEGVAA